MIRIGAEQLTRLYDQGFWRKHFNGDDYPGYTWGFGDLLITKKIQHEGLIETFDAAFPQNDYWKITTLARLLESDSIALITMKLERTTDWEQFSQLQGELMNSIAGGLPGESGFTKKNWIAFQENAPYRELIETLFIEQAYRANIGIIPGEENRTGWGHINGLNIFLYDQIWQIFGTEPTINADEEIRQKYEELTAGLGDNNPADIALKGRLTQLRDSAIAIFSEMDELLEAANTTSDN